MRAVAKVTRGPSRGRRTIVCQADSSSSSSNVMKVINDDNGEATKALQDSAIGY